jgi:hypothetical protein
LVLSVRDRSAWAGCIMCGERGAVGVREAPGAGARGALPCERD